MSRKLVENSDNRSNFAIQMNATGAIYTSPDETPDFTPHMSAWRGGLAPLDLAVVQEPVLPTEEQL